MAPNGSTRRFSALLLASIAAAAAVAAAVETPAGTDAMRSIAEGYVKLVLRVGQHDPDYVDAYYGPPEWRPKEKDPKPDVATLRSDAASLLKALESVQRPAEELDRLRHDFIVTQTQAVDAKIRILQGERLSFDDESRALYNAVAPRHPESYFNGILAELGRLLPGNGALLDRYEAYQQGFAIPRSKLEAVFSAALDECRTRTRQHIDLPAHEKFSIEYVTNKPWSGYNWYQGNANSLIQVNTDLPIYIHRALGLACHEGYPGHHVYHLLMEEQMVRRRGWVEFTVYPLFGPQSLIAEGTADFGIDVAFPRDERSTFERDKLFPLAGIDASRADEYNRVQKLVQRLRRAETTAAARYLDGELTRDQTIEWLRRYTLTTPQRAEQRLRFIDRYRSYIINYTHGEDLVRAYIEKRGGTDDQRRWSEFTRLLSLPLLPSGLN
jgi:hypothetical protein